VNFQTSHPAGAKFAEDLFSLGYHSFGELKQKDAGAKLFEEYERKERPLD